MLEIVRDDMDWRDRKDALISFEVCPWMQRVLKISEPGKLEWVRLIFDYIILAVFDNGMVVSKFLTKTKSKKALINSTLPLTI